MVRRNVSYQQLLMDSLDSAEKSANSVATNRRADAENTRQETESKDRAKLIGEQTRAAKLAGDENQLSFDKAFKEKTLQDSLGAATTAQSAALEGTPTADGHAVDFQGVKKANKDFKGADAALWNFINRDKPLTADQLAEKRVRDVAGEELVAEEKQADATRKQETHLSNLENDKATRLSGRFSPVALEGGGIGRFNTKTGDVEDTGSRGAQKPGKTGVVKTGGILVPGFQEMDGVEITKDSVRKVKDASAAIADVKRQLTDLRAAYKKFGPSMVGEDAARLSSLAKQLQTTIKGDQFLTLGVIQKADLPFIESMAPDPTKANIENLQGVLARKTDGVGDPVAARFDELEKYLDGKVDSFAKANGFEREASAPDLSDDDLDAQLLAKGIDPVTGKRISKGGSSGSF